ncbi:MAG: MFS transporter [Desulfobacterales bacterium]|jgi:MFS transporter, PPP family, 3-phenylpropionic acid transporter
MTSRRPLLAIRIQYFLYFGVLGIYLPYFNLYCYHLGFSGAQIGGLSAVRSVVMVFFSLVWGLLADRFHRRRGIFIFCSVGSALIWASFLFTVDFWLMLMITVVYIAFYAPIISFLEAFTMDQLENRKAAYGRIRVWGSISFIMVVIVLGRVIDLFPIRLTVVLILAGSLVQAAGALRMPGAPSDRQPFAIAALGSLLNRQVIVFLASGFLMLVGHGAYYGFFSIHLENLGYSRTFIGVAWAVASLAEILVMVKSEALFKRYSLEKVLIFSFAVAAVRWSVLYFARSPALILSVQTLHAVTYGTFHMASIIWIDRLAPVQAKTVGQSVNNAVQYGLGLMAGFFLNGFLYERIGSAALFLMSAGIALAGGALFWGGTRVIGGSLRNGDMP